ncbi:DUF7507 domain-containing protein, partial [Aequorivita sinensis]|uniref:DUF7507 domain-containing protein n=2 Tax=Aequorivita sinensis TaxID=1382458 RepID=UPI0038B389B9
TQTIYVYAQTGTSPNCTAENSFVVTINDCGINIEKIASPNNTQGCTPLAVGESISYTFKVTNNGTTPINNVVVTDVMIPTISNPTGDTNNDGKLDVSEIWEFTGSYVVTAQDIINGQVVNTANVTGEAEASTPFPVSGSDTETVNLCQNAEMSIVKSTSSATTDCINFNVGDTIDYEFVVTNEGDVDIEDVVITDPLFESPNPIVTINLVSGDINNDGILNVGEFWTFKATYSVDQDNIDAGSIVNTATVNGNSALGPVDTATSNTVTVLICTDASIALIKTSDVEVDPTTGCSTLAVGDVINYSFSVKNTGNVTLTDVMVSDLVGGVTVSGGPITLAPGEEDTTTFTASYTITQADINAGEFENTAKVVGTTPSNTQVDDESDNSSYTGNNPTVVTICTDASIALIKTSDVEVDPTTGCSTLAVGDVINYSFSVKNTGNVTLTDVMVSDLVGGVTVSGGPITLDPGAEDFSTFTATYTITQADIDNGTFTNTALVVGTTPSSTQVDDESDNSSYTGNNPTVVTICTDASIALIKTSDVEVDPTTGCSTLAVGDVINYSFSVKNTGNVTLTDVMVSDLVGGVTVAGGPIT